MTRQEFIEAYPTPDYVTIAWRALHSEPGVCNANVSAWEDACRRARAEADAAFDAQQRARAREHS